MAERVEVSPPQVDGNVHPRGPGIGRTRVGYCRAPGRDGTVSHA